MKSMTGFGRSECEAPYGKIIAEIQSVNRKYLEIYVSLPKEFARFENDLRKLVGERVQRGLVSVRVHLIPNASSACDLLPDLSLLENLKSGWMGLAMKLGYPKETVDFSFLVQQASEMPQIKLVQMEDFEPIRVCMKEAFEGLDEMRSKEGIALAKEIVERLKSMSILIASIEKKSPEAVAKTRLKLKERLEELFQPGGELDDRLLREVALFAERVDITEEITRFRSHVVQYEELLRTKGRASGRKMDFLVQEMGREINTIGSKSMDASIAHQVVDLKAELEKVREQIQNIE
jgi:uncharacterized protein (TIGR00255 family)